MDKMEFDNFLSIMPIIFVQFFDSTCKKCGFPLAQHSDRRAITRATVLIAQVLKYGLPLTQLS